MRARPFGHLAIIAALAPCPAFASPPEPGKELNAQLDTVSEIPEEHERAKKKSSDLLIVPIPQSSPSLGFGVTLAAALFYNPNESKEPWISGVGVMKTTNGSVGAGAVHKMALAHDRFRIVAFAGYADVNLKFYGIGPNAGDRDISVDIEDEGYAFMLQGQMRVAENLYAGPRFQYLDVTTSIDIPNPRFPDEELPRAQFDSRLAQLGATISYDRRDSSLNPTHGEVVSAAWLFGVKGLGSDFDHDKFSLSGNLYRPLGDGGVIALRAALCGVSTRAPFYDLCLYGASSDLRGYETGRYRDRASWAVQYEVRQHLFGRFGAVAFAGIGGTAPKLGDLGDSKILPAAGIGVRYRASRETPVNLRIDYAVGLDSHTLYLSIGEAF